jgi:hypothetical protein
MSPNLVAIIPVFAIYNSLGSSDINKYYLKSQ